MKRKDLLDIEPCEAPETDREGIQAAAQLSEVNGAIWLNIDLFDGQLLKGRYFANKKTWYAWIGEWTQMRMKNVVRAINGEKALKGASYWWENDDYHYASEKDREMVNNYLGTILSYFEDHVLGERTVKRMQRKQERINAVMDLVPTVPDRMAQWLDEEIFTEGYLFVDEKGNRNYYTCTKCGKRSWTTRKFAQYKQIACPKCGSLVKVEKRREQRNRREQIVLIQGLRDGRWIERQFKAECQWSRSGKEIELYENVRCLLRKGEHWGDMYYGTLNQADELEQEWWDKKSRNQQFQRSYLYPYNLDEVLPDTGLQYLGLDQIAKKGRKINVNRMIIGSVGREYLEYLVKSGLLRLAEETCQIYWKEPLDPYAKTMQDLLKINGDRISRLKQIDGGMAALSWLRWEEEAEGERKLSQEALEYLEQKNMYPNDCEKILQAVGSPTRMVNYLKKHKKATVSLWTDYLQMAEEEGMDIEDDIVCRPKDIKARHDELVERRNERQDAEKIKKNQEKYRAMNQEIVKYLPCVARFFWESEQYEIIPAGRCEELIKEGRILHHCVGASDRYMEKMAAGESWILFLRKKEDLETPYYTIEISMKTDRILQWYSAYDRKPQEKTIQKVLKQFLTEIKQKQVRISA